MIKKLLLKNQIKKQGLVLPCFFYEKTDSTNTRAKELIKKGGLSSFVVVANTQTKGRGRYDRTFLSEKGKGLYFTVVFPCKQENLLNLSGFSALAAKKAVKALSGMDADIKWPNDLLYKGRKLCGILPESVAIGDIRYAVIGVGINLNYCEKEFGELKDKAISLYMATGNKYSILNAAALLAKEMILINEQIENRYDNLYQEYVNASCILNKRIMFKHNAKEKRGVAEKIGKDCSLVIKGDDGITYEIQWGEVIMAI
jgi:BirA family biotin operon repressor/biotin-[acetyl-CoA-carboxylase] ligase